MGWLCVQEAPSPPARVCESHQPEPRLCPLPSPPPPSPQALGCILYLLCFGQHPFEDGARLRILNGKYSIPADDTRYLVFHSLIRESRVWGLLGVPLPRPAWLLGSFPSVGFPTEHLPVGLWESQRSRWWVVLLHLVVALQGTTSLAVKVRNLCERRGLGQGCGTLGP